MICLEEYLRWEIYARSIDDGGRERLGALATPDQLLAGEEWSRTLDEGYGKVQQWPLAEWVTHDGEYSPGTRDNSVDIRTEMVFLKDVDPSMEVIVPAAILLGNANCVAIVKRAVVTGSGSAWAENKERAEEVKLEDDVYIVPTGGEMPEWVEERMLEDFYPHLLPDEEED